MKKLSFLLIIISIFQICLLRSESEDDLSPIDLTGFEEDYHRVNEAIHYAHMLADLGAGYEAARVLAAIASRAANTDFGNHAHQILNEWDITIEHIQQGNIQDINKKIAESRRKTSQSRSNVAHVRNLVELGLYAEASSLLRQESAKNNKATMKEKWGEILDHFHFSIDLLYHQNSGANDKLLKALQAGHERNQLKFQSRLLRSIDRESSEMAEMLFRHSALYTDEDGHSDHHRRPFEIWVEKHDEWEEDRNEFDVEQLIPRILDHAVEIAHDNSISAHILASLVIKSNPDSKLVKKAHDLIKDLSIPSANKLESRTILKNGDGEDLFGLEKVHSYHLELSNEAIQQLHEDPKHYVRAIFREGDDIYEDVGVRLKGGHGSFRMLDGNSKAAFTIKFNHFVKGQRFHGLRRIILNNAVQDPTYMSEYIGYSLFRRAGVPAPRIGYAMLAINQEPYGMYVQVEAVSKDFLKRWYTKTEGNLYEGPMDVTEWREMDLDSNQGRENRRDLRRLAKSIEKAGENNPWESLKNLVNLGNFSRFIALEQLVNHWDGYTQTNNYRMYHNPETKKFEFFPHGADQLFQDLRGDIFCDQGGILSRALIETGSGKEIYHQVMKQLLDQVWNESKIKSQIAEVYRLIHPYLVKELGKKYQHRRVEDFEQSTRRLLQFIDARRFAVLSQLQDAEQKPSWREHRRTGFRSYLIHY